MQKIMVSIDLKYTYILNLLGLDEIIKKLWNIADSPKTGSKEKIKAIVLIGEYYREIAAY